MESVLALYTNSTNPSYLNTPWSQHVWISDFLLLCHLMIKTFFDVMRRESRGKWKLAVSRDQTQLGVEESESWQSLGTKPRVSHLWPTIELHQLDNHLPSQSYWTCGTEYLSHTPGSHRWCYRCHMIQRTQQMMMSDDEYCDIIIL